MYINDIKLKNFRTFEETNITFVHPDQNFKKLNIPTPKLNNINLLLGNNGSGKSALLKAIGLSAMGPAVSTFGNYQQGFVRKNPNLPTKKQNLKKTLQNYSEAILEANFTPHDQDAVPKSIKIIESKIKIERNEDFESFLWLHHDTKTWHPVYSANSDAFFVVGYGATRRVENQSNIDPSSRNANSFIRSQRIKGLFEDSYSLYPLGTWLPRFKTANPGRYKQVVNLINELLGDGKYKFDGELQNGEFIFEMNGLKIPFTALSDGYRAFLGWIGDLLYHVCETCPSGKKLRENKGIVLIDEIDLHLHPKWQMTILPTLSKCLPNIQFIVTSHSPLVVGTLEWMNIIVMKLDTEKMISYPTRLEESVHGLDADQILLTDFFGMESTRVEEKEKSLKELSLSASKGNADAALELLKQMTGGMESAK